ncbi:MAG TPA: proteasome activator [Acidimicrobiales bacterium]|nr:proteasome activator [Acidimicrobiales bacterium]
MSTTQNPTPGPSALEVVEQTSEEVQETETVNQPAKLMRIGSMLKQLLDEAKAAPLDEKARIRLREIYETSVHELAAGLSSDLQTELASMALPFDADAPSEAELRVAQAQIVGWLEGLFHGIQATLFAQQMAARSELEQMRRPQLGRGPVPGEDAQPGNYL